MRAFVDTSVWFAAVNKRDRDHERAKEILGKIQSPLTSTLVAAEAWRLMAQRLHWDAAESFLAVIRRGAAEVEAVGNPDFEAAWAIGQRFRDQSFSLTDRTSFAVMERLQVHSAASFDNDFAIYRFGGGKTGAFELIG